LAQNFKELLSNHSNEESEKRKATTTTAATAMKTHEKPVTVVVTKVVKA
jgi:flagellar hook-basal body complex protein FliE